MKKKTAMLISILILFAITTTGMRQYLLNKSVKHTTSIYATTANENDDYAAETQQGTTQSLFPINYGMHAEFQDEASETKKLVKQ